MNTFWRAVALLCLVVVPDLQADEDTFALPEVKLNRIADANITIDGKLDEAVWQTLPAYDDYHVIQPDSLAKPTYRTAVRLFYNERGLYVAFDLEQPRETLVARLTSRDQPVSRDSVSVTIDPSGEGLYGYWFSVNLGDTLSDGTVLPERQFSRQWDGPWYGASAVTDTGWTAEYFLPWSMVTMPDLASETRTIGFYTSRGVSHLNERWAWPALPATRPRFMSALQKLSISNITPRKQFTFYPYASTAYNVIESEDEYKAGFDVFWRPSSNLQLTATVNPDFGNVESDDVDVNLTALETFFPEKRPFFLEGREIFNTTPRARPSGTRSNPTVLVYTRRIGGPPVALDDDSLELTELEENQPTELDGAAKITGQINNWRYGVLAAVEDDTKIEGLRNGEEVDLLQDGRNFGSARLLYETTTGGGRRGLGWITTAVTHPQKDAYVHGIDGHYLSAKGIWNVDAQLLYSDVGDETGAGAFADITYVPAQGVRHTLGLDYYDDQLEINDFGFMRRNDAIAARYRLTLTESNLEYAKSREIRLFANQEYNTDGRVVRSGLFSRVDFEFQNNMELSAELNYFPGRWDDLNSEGNGDYKIDHRWQTGFFLETDRAKSLQHGFGYRYTGEDIGGQRNLWRYQINWRPSDRFSTSLNLRYIDRTDWLLYTSERDFTTYETEYWQPEFAVDYFFTARQQLRLTAQWIGIKAFEQNRWQVPAGDGTLLPDQDPADGSRDFSISRLVFQARYRWEIAPLSDLFVVYTRGSDVDSMPELDFDDLIRDSWTERAVDIFVVKLRYRLGS